MDIANVKLFIIKFFEYKSLRQNVRFSTPLTIYIYSIHKHTYKPLYSIYELCSCVHVHSCLFMLHGPEHKPELGKGHRNVFFRNTYNKNNKKSMQSLYNLKLGDHYVYSASINFVEILKLDFCFYRDGVP
jgi:hypothetical protein